MVVFHEVVNRLLALPEEQHKEVLAFVEELEKKVTARRGPLRSSAGILKGQFTDLSAEEMEEAMLQHYERIVKDLAARLHNGQRPA